MSEQIQQKNGLFSAILCYILWGLLPIYWKALIPIESIIIIFYRTFLAGFTCLLFSLKFYGWKAIRNNIQPKGTRLRHFAAGMLITVNMGLYVWAVNAGHVIQAGLGYYMQPLVVSLCGIMIFREKLTKGKMTALLLTIAGLLIYLLYLGEITVLAVGMALVFGLYAAMKKGSKLPAALSLFYEMMYIMPVFLLVIIYLEITGQGAIGMGETYQCGLLLMSGLVTAAPLMLFSQAAGKIPMITLGLIEYINPSIQLLLGIFVFREPFDRVQFATLAVIWIGLAIFLIEERRIERADDLRAELDQSDEDSKGNDV